MGLPIVPVIRLACGPPIHPVPLARQPVVDHHRAGPFSMPRTSSGNPKGAGDQGQATSGQATSGLGSCGKCVTQVMLRIAGPSTVSDPASPGNACERVDQWIVPLIQNQRDPSCPDRTLASIPHD